MSFYNRLTFELPESEQDWLSIELFARGALGVTLEEVEGETAGREVEGALGLVAYCPDPLPTGLERVGDSWTGRGIRLVGRERCAPRDWLAAYRAASVPTDIGRGFVVDPREPDESAGGGPTSAPRVLLRVPARRAFGTGSHPSTRITIEWMEDLDLGGRRVLDVGAGTSILSMAALHLGAAEAIGIDVDPVACFVASETLALNGSSARLVAGGLDCLGGAPFDVALVNILPSEWLAGAAALTPRLADGGLAIVSGVPTEQVAEVTEALRAIGLETRETRVEGEWAALRLTRTA